MLERTRSPLGTFLPKARTPPANGAQASRIKLLRRAFQKRLGHKPTTLELLALRRAATLLARAEAADNDPSVSHEDIVRLHGLAMRAEAALMDMIERRHRRERDDAAVSPFATPVMGRRDRGA